MVFMHNAPPAVVFTEPHRQPKFQIDLLAAAEIATSSNRGCKRHIVPRSYLNVVKIELHRLGLQSKEPIPRSHICVQTARKKRRRHIEHQNIGVMIRPNSRKVLVADCLGPSRDQLPKLRLILRVFSRICHRVLPFLCLPTIFAAYKRQQKLLSL